MNNQIPLQDQQRTPVGSRESCFPPWHLHHQQKWWCTKIPLCRMWGLCIPFPVKLCNQYTGVITCLALHYHNIVSPEYTVCHAYPVIVRCFCTAYFRNVIFKPRMSCPWSPCKEQNCFVSLEWLEMEAMQGYPTQVYVDMIKAPLVAMATLMATLTSRRHEPRRDQQSMPSLW